MFHAPAPIAPKDSSLPPRRSEIGFKDFWHNVTVRAWAYQIIIVLIVLAGAAYLVGNAQDALQRLGVNTGFDFLFETVGFDIGETPIAFTSADNFLKAYFAAFLNTIKVSAIGVILATIIGLVIGLGRLSSNILIRTLASTYVELFRNTPQLVQLIFWYTLITQLPVAKQAISILDVAFISNRGLVFPWPAEGDVFAWAFAAFAGACIAAFFLLRWADVRRRATGRANSAAAWAVGLIISVPIIVWASQGAPTSLTIPSLQGFNFRGGISISPEFLALLLGLSLYIAAFIAEIVRSGIQSVGRGQIEAARAIGLKPADTYRKILLPQALRVMVPPAAAQYVSLVKNSSLGVAIGYPELFNVNNTIITLSGHTIEAIGIMMAIYLSISLSIAALMNLYNRAVQIRER